MNLELPREDLLQRLVSRDALPGDEMAIAAIDPDLHGGLDQLPALFLQYLKDPSRRARVCLLDRQIIAFEMVYLVDGGRTVVHQSLRLHPALRGKGLWPQIRKELSQPGNMDFPYATRLALTTAAKSVYLKRMRTYPRNTFNYVMERPTIRVRPTNADIKSWAERCTFSSFLPTFPLAVTDQQEGMSILQNKSNQAFLFPHDRIILSWEPFRLLSSNLSGIVNRYQGLHLMCVSPPETENQSTAKSVEMKSISFGRALRVPSGLRYDLEYYGYDVMDASAHIQKHLFNSLRTYRGGTLSLEVFVPVTLNQDALRNHIEGQLKLPCLRPGLVCHLFEGPYLSSRL